MPLQVKPIPLAIVNFRYASNPAASIRYFAKASKVARMIDALHFGFADGCKPRQLLELLATDHHNPAAARAFYTAVLSVKTPANASPDELADIDDRIEQAVRDLAKKFGVPVVAWLHKNTKTRHAHLIFPNSDGRRTIPLPQKVLQELQDFGWTTALVSGRGKGERKALPVYPKARSLRVRDLANQLLDKSGQFVPEQLEVLLKAGVFTAARRRKNGTLISFEVNQQRVRVATLEGFVREITNTNVQNTNTQKPMIAIIKPGAPLPKEVVENLKTGGYDLKAFQALIDEFASTRAGRAAARAHEQATNKNQQPTTH